MRASSIRSTIHQNHPIHMKINITSSLRRSLALAVAVLGLAALGASHALAQASLTFGGGLGMPLTLTLNAPVTYVVTMAAANAPYVVFQSVGNVLGSRPVSGTLTFTINGGAPQSFTYLNSGASGGGGAEVPADAFLYGSMPGLAVGNTVVLNAGTLTTTGNFTGAPPASMSYQTFLTDGNDDKLDAVNGVSAAPEPSTWALMDLGAAGVGLTLRRRATRV